MRCDRLAVDGESGDACDECVDTDGDGVCDPDDKCEGSDDTEVGLNVLGGVGFSKRGPIRPYVQGKVILADNTEAAIAWEHACQQARFRRAARVTAASTFGVFAAIQLAVEPAAEEVVTPAEAPAEEAQG